MPDVQNTSSSSPLRTSRTCGRVKAGVHLYKVSDLDPDEWYFDTGAYTEINFTAFAMLGKSFCPRMKNIKDQWLYKINPGKDYGSLNKPDSTGFSGEISRH
jgi:TnpA family transposase